MRTTLSKMLVTCALVALACDGEFTEDVGPPTVKHEAEAGRSGNIDVKYTLTGVRTNAGFTQGGCSCVRESEQEPGDVVKEGKTIRDVEGVNGATVTTLRIDDLSVAVIERDFESKRVSDVAVGEGTELRVTYTAGFKPEFVFDVTCLGAGTTVLTIDTTVTDSTNTLKPISIPVDCSEPTADWSQDPDLQSLAVIADAFELDSDEVCTWVVDPFDDSDTVHSSPAGGTKPKEDDHTSSAKLAAGPASVDQDAVDEVFNGTDARAAPLFPCGEGPVSAVLCTPGHGDFPAGEAVFVANLTRGEIPLDDPTHTYQYGFVFDSDGDASNNYVPDPAFPNDFFADTDLWYVAAYDPAQGWRLEVTDARDGDFVSQESDARLIVTDNGLVLVVPTSEFEIADPPVRMTSFRHTGDFGMGGDRNWNGDVQPAVLQGLFEW